MGRTPIRAAASLAAAIFLLVCAGAAWMLAPRQGQGLGLAERREGTAVAGNGPAEAARNSAGPAAPAGFPDLTPQTPAEVRQVVRHARAAGASSVGELREAAGAPDPLVAGNALRALGRLGELDGARYLDDPRPRVRQEAVVSLGLSRKSEAVAHLEWALEHGEAGIRPLALQALGRIGSPEARAVLAGQLSSADLPEVERAFAREALAAATP